MKSKYINLLVAVLAIVSMTACEKNVVNPDDEALTQNETSIQKYLSSNNLTATRDSSGLYFVRLQTNPQGAKPKVGDEISIYYKMYTLEGTLIDSTETTQQKPLRFPLGVGFHLPGVERGISLMRAGEKMTMLLPFYLAFGNVKYQGIPAYSPIRVEVQLASVRTEAQQIAQYIQDKDYFVSEVTPGGIHIIRQNIMAGDSIGKGKQVSVNYVGKNLSGVEFDKGTFPFVTGTGAAIRGFDEGVRHLRKGEKAIIVFPSALGYGRQGVQNQQTGAYKIRPYAPLVFEIEVPQ
jgi:FKBP-type peptidyl-prolyl cis-trans isomerase